jgi:nucleotide-binding universal stress UspA family protein
MPSFHKILFPTDFSEPCAQTAPYVAGLAEKFDSRVTLLHAFDAYDPFGYGAASATASYAEEVPALWQQREAAMERFGSDAFKELAVDRTIVDGTPAESIVRYAQNHGIDLIVMPTHGYGGFRRLLLGSVTARVLHSAGCPVLTTSHCETLEKRCAQCINHIVCGVDLGSDSIQLIRSAYELAQIYQASLRLVHAVNPNGLGSGEVIADAPFQRFLVETANEKLSELQRELHTHLDASVKRGSIPNVIREVATEDHAELTIIGRGHPDKLLGSLRTHANAIVRESPCPVLSF